LIITLPQMLQLLMGSSPFFTPQCLTDQGSAPMVSVVGLASGAAWLCPTGCGCAGVCGGAGVEALGGAGVVAGGGVLCPLSLLWAKTATLEKANHRAVARAAERNFIGDS